MKFLFFGLFFLTTSFLFSQKNEKIVITSFVDNDTIFLRFGLSSPDLLKEILRYGLKIERFENSINNLNSKKTSVLLPAQQIIKSEIYKSNEKMIEISELITTFIEMSSDDEGNEMLFAILMLSSVTDKDFLNALGLIYYDVDFEKNKNYVYKVSINSDKKELETLTSTTNINTKIINKNINFNSLIFEARVKTESVFLQWNAKEISSHYSAFWVEKSVDSINFKSLNDAPIFLVASQYEKNKVLAEYLDTSVVEGETYYYRIRGINHFAEKGGYSNIVKVYIQKSLKGEVRIDTVYANKFDRVIIGGYHSLDFKDEEKLSHFIVFRSDSMSFGYEKINVENIKAGSDFEFHVNSTLETGDRYYYKVAAISVDNDTVFSFHSYFFTLDQIPPEVPTGLRGVIDEKGIVSLKWNQNPDKDIRGYRVFWANSQNEEFVEATNDFVNDTLFSDTILLNNLTSEIYYQIRAVDLNYNNSKPCEPVKLLKPDTIPPVPCVFTYYKVTPKGIVLKWNNSSSVDVNNNYLIRTSFKTKYIDTILVWNDTLSYYTDQSVDGGQIYIYKIITTDEVPNFTMSDSLNINNETGIRPPIKNLKYVIDRENKKIILTWDQDNSEVYSYKIFRSKNEGKFILYKTIIVEDENIFTDKTLYINNVYHYKIKVVYKNGVNSSFSNVIDVSF